MLTLPPSVRIDMAVEPVDLRRGHDGLAALVRTQWGLDVYAGHLFVVLGRRRDRCKILFVEGASVVRRVLEAVGVRDLARSSVDRASRAWSRTAARSPSSRARSPDVQ